MDDLALTCHMISLVRALERPKIGKKLNNPIVCISMDGKIQFCNPAFEKMVEKEMPDLVGMQIFSESPGIKKSVDTAYEVGACVDTGMFGGKKVKWKCELISPGDAYFLFSGEILTQSEKVIGFPARQAAR